MWSGHSCPLPLTFSVVSATGKGTTSYVQKKTDSGVVLKGRGFSAAP
jgi:hypothetical protein